jgi:hypothetical protein
MAYIAQVQPGPVAVTFSIGGVTTTVPPATTLPPASPGVSTPAPPHQPLPLTGAPVLAGVDLALLLTVAGALFVTLANRLADRVVPRPGR